MRKEFDTVRLSPAALSATHKVAEIFSETLTQLEEIVPRGRELALIVTKLQEAKFFACKGISESSGAQQELLLG